MTNQEYMADPDWTLPPEMRLFLVTDLEWSLLGL